MDPRVKRHAEVLMRYSLALKKGDKLIIQGEHFTLPLIKECYRLALELGAHPQVKILNSELSEIMMKQGSDQQLTFIHESDKVAIKTADALLTSRSPARATPRYSSYSSSGWPRTSCGGAGPCSRASPMPRRPACPCPNMRTLSITPVI